MAKLIAAALLAGLLVACNGGESSPAATPTVDIESVPAFTLNGCTPRSEALMGHGRCDPVNLVFPGATANDVTAAFVSAGWTIETLGTTQVVIADGRELPQVVQLINSDGTTVAPQRFHVRIWELPNRLTIGSVHHEAAGVGHEIDRDWEDAEARVRDDLCQDGATCEDGDVIEEQRAQQNGDDRWRRFLNDGRPTIVRLPPAN